MPRRKVERISQKGIKLVPPYPPNKNIDEAWSKCLRNSDLIHILLFRDPSPLNWGPVVDFESEEQRKSTWARNRSLLMGMKGTGWIEEDYTTSQRDGYYVGNRPWGYWEYDIGQQFDFRHAWSGFQKKQYYYLRDHDMLGQDEERLVQIYCSAIVAEHEDGLGRHSGDAEEEIKRHKLRKKTKVKVDMAEKA